MNVVTTHVGNVAVLRVGKRLTYPILADFATVAAVTIAAGEKRIIVTTAPVSYVDSATIVPDGPHRQAGAPASAKLSGAETGGTMLAMTGAHNFLEVTPTRRRPSPASEASMRNITTIGGTHPARRRRAGRPGTKCRASFCAAANKIWLRGPINRSRTSCRSCRRRTSRAEGKPLMSFNRCENDQMAAILRRRRAKRKGHE